jgi:ABC-type Zn uptake system ZnuABC Zn-binding protein ZnuA
MALLRKIEVVNRCISMFCLKRLFVAVIAFFPLAAEAKEVRVATSFYPVYIMALNAVKDASGVRVVNVTPMATGCLHDYSLTSADMKRLAAADIFFTNGAGMESFIETVARQFKGLRIVPLSAGIPLLRNADGTDNPHVWVSIGNAVTQVRNLGNALISFDPGNKQIYERNTENYMRAAGVAESVYEKNPKHPGALHYLIHAYDDPVHAPLGLRAARLYGSVAEESVRGVTDEV